MLPYRDSRLTYIALGVFFLIVVGYAYYEAQGVLFGPSIKVTSQVSEVQEPFVMIRGQAERIASLSMNGKPISVTEEGIFEEPYLLAPGYNRIVLEAKDKYGRRRSAEIEIIYTPSFAKASEGEPSPAAFIATSTASSTSTP